jgi:glycosyltransferase involved in cell wall biosynthesis
MRALVVTNMYPSPERPALGRFVADQVAALRELPELDVEVFAFPPGGAGAYLAAARELRRRHRRDRFDVVHAHFGLTVWPALWVPAAVRAVTLHGTDLAHPRSRPVSLAGLPLCDLVGVVSGELRRSLPGWAVRRAAVEVLPCGVDLGRFAPVPRPQAREALGLDPCGRYLLFSADPDRPEKRHDLASSLAQAVGTRLLTLGAVEPERVPLFVNAADAVLVTSDREGFGLAVLEAIACEVPVLATPHGVAPEALSGLGATLCEPFSLSRWADRARELLASGRDPRVPGGRARAERYSSTAMAGRVAAAWRAALR